MFKLTLEKQIPLAFVIAIILLVIISLFTLRSTNSIDDAVRWEKHTQEVLLGLDELLLSTVDAETSSRGYINTGNDLFLEPMTVAERQNLENIKTLQSLLKDNPEQLEKLEKLRFQISEKMLYLKQAVAIRRGEGLNASIELANKGLGKQLMDRIRVTVGEMKTEERKLLQMREDDLTQSINGTNRMLLLGSIAGIIAVGLANFAIFRETGKRRKAENLLRDTNKNLETKIEERTHEIQQKNEELTRQIEISNLLEQRRKIALEAGNLGMWTMHPANQAVEMDDRSLAFFGLEKDLFDGDTAKLFNLLDERDSSSVKELLQKSLTDHSNFNAEFRIKMPDGNIRWNHCIGQPQLNENGEVKSLIGFCRDITDYKNHENILLERENFTRAILDSLSAHIAVIDKNGKILAVNKAWEEFAQNNSAEGEENKTGVGQNYIKLSETEESFDKETKAIMKNFRSILAGEISSFLREYPCHSPSESRWFMLQVNALQNKDGGAVVSHINITDRKRAEEDLRQSEEFSRSIFENSPDCVKILELDGVLHSMNANGMCIMEIEDFAEFKGRVWADFWSGAEYRKATEAVEKARLGKTSRFEGYTPTAKGNLKYWDVTVAPIFDKEGKPRRIISTSRDITERQRAEKSIAHLAAIVESSNDAIISKDLNGVITSWNKGAENLFGYTAEEAISQSITLLIPPEQIDEESRILERVRRGEKVILYETVRQRKDRSKVEISLTVSPILDNSGNIVGASKIVHDITERRQSEAEREKLLAREQSARKDAEIANRLRDEFLATVSHELRAPLNSILGWAKLMQQGKLDETTTGKAVETIVRNANSQNRLIEDLLDVSRIISGKLRLEVMQVQPMTFVEAAMESVRPAAEAKNIALEIKEDAGISHISGDPNRLQQVVWNLLSNAIKFTPNGGRVAIDIQRTNGEVEIKVKDTGIGIKKEFLPHVFDRFRQADASSIRQFGGLGLGLAIVRHITEMHGGTVAVESEGENQGTTFTVKLPVLVGVEEEIAGSNGNSDDFTDLETNLRLDGLLILVVDDEADARQLLVQALTHFGATVTTASSAEEALTEVSLKNPDIIVSDIGMPNEDGYSLMRRIRQLPDEKANIPAIALTAFSRAQDRTRALAAGFQSHVAKPVELEELATVVASLMGRLQINDGNQ